MKEFFSAFNVGDLSSLLGAFLGAWIAGITTLRASSKQISYLKISQQEQDVVNQKRVLLVIKNKLNEPINLVNNLMKTGEYLVQQFDKDVNFDSLKRAGESLSVTKNYLSTNAFRIDPEILYDIYDLLETIDVLLNYTFKNSTSTSWEELFATCSDEKLRNAEKNFRDLIKKMGY